MAKVRFTKKAIYDLKSIWNYTADQWSVKRADTYYELLIEKCGFVANHQASGKSYEMVYPGLKGIRSQKHIIFYRVLNEQEIEVIRILHERMDLKTNFLNP